MFILTDSAHRRSQLQSLMHIQRKAEIEILSFLTFASLPRPTLAHSNHEILQTPPAPLNTHSDMFPPALNQLYPQETRRAELTETWNALADGPLIIPYLVSKMAAFCPPITV